MKQPLTQRHTHPFSPKPTHPVAHLVAHQTPQRESKPIGACDPSNSVVKFAKPSTEIPTAFPSRFLFRANPSTLRFLSPSLCFSAMARTKKVQRLRAQQNPHVNAHKFSVPAKSTTATTPDRAKRNIPAAAVSPVDQQSHPSSDSESSEESSCSYCPTDEETEEEPEEFLTMPPKKMNPRQVAALRAEAARHFRIRPPAPAPPNQGNAAVAPAANQGNAAAAPAANQRNAAPALAANQANAAAAPAAQADNNAPREATASVSAASSGAPAASAPNSTREQTPSAGGRPDEQATAPDVPLARRRKFQGGSPSKPPANARESIPTKTPTKTPTKPATKPAAKSSAARKPTAKTKTPPFNQFRWIGQEAESGGSS